MGRVKEAIQDALDQHGDVIHASYYKAQKFSWDDVILFYLDSEFNDSPV